MSLLRMLSPLTLLTQVKAGIKSLNWEFWIGNLFIVFSTVLGVYLAAHAALETAIQYDTVRTDRDNYYMRSSLRDELNNNLVVLEKIIENLREGRRYRIKDQYVTHPQYFVWESFKTSSSALTTPSKILSGVSEFYENSRIVLNKVSERKDFQMGMSANDLEKQAEKLKLTTLPLLEKNLQELRENLISSEIEF